jgi:hypothetical protein
MSITLFDLVYRCMVELGTVRTGVATGGSPTTIIDTNGLKLVENDYYNEGTLFILADAGGAVDISKLYSTIKDYNSATKTATVYTGFATAITADDRYAIANRRYPLDMLKQKINNVLYMGGDIPVEDQSLTTVANQLEYTLPDGVAATDLRQVLVATTTTANAPHWRPVVNWDVEYADAGSIGKLCLEYELPAGYTLALKYATPHGELSDATDTLHDAIHGDRVVYQACADALRWYKDKTRLRHLKDSIEMMELKAERAKERHPLPTLPSRQARITKVTRTMDIDAYGRSW